MNMSATAAMRVASSLELISTIWEHVIVTYRDGCHLSPSLQDGKIIWAEAEDDYTPPKNKHAWLVDCLLLQRAWKEEIDRLRWRHVEVEICQSSFYSGPLAKLGVDRSLGPLCRTLMIPNEADGDFALQNADRTDYLDLDEAETGVLQDRLRFLSRCCINVQELEIDREWIRIDRSNHCCLRRRAAWIGVGPFRCMTTLVLGWSSDDIVWSILRCTPQLHTLILREHDADPPLQLMQTQDDEAWPLLRRLECHSCAGAGPDGQEETWSDVQWLDYGQSLNRLLDRTGRQIQQLSFLNLPPETVLSVLRGRKMPKLQNLSLFLCATGPSELGNWTDGLVHSAAEAIGELPTPKLGLDFATLDGPERRPLLISWLEDLAKEGRTPSHVKINFPNEWVDDASDAGEAEQAAS